MPRLRHAPPIAAPLLALLLAGCGRGDHPLLALDAGAAGGAAVPVALAPASGRFWLRAELPGAAAAARYRLALLDGPQMFKFAAELAPRGPEGGRYVELLLPVASLGTGARRVLLIDAGTGAVVSEWTLEVAAPGA